MIHTKYRLTCRKAQLSDVRTYYVWAKDKTVRKNAFSKNKITWNSHKVWFKKKLNSKNSNLYLFNHNNSLIGQVRFDRNKNLVKIDYSLKKSFRGLGLGKKIVQLAIKRYKLKKHVTFVGVVKKINIPSIKVFQSLGFHKIVKKKVYSFQKKI